MIRICGATGNKLLEQLAASRLLLAFDFDGTLAPIVASRDDAKMRSSTAKLFRQVCRSYPCAVISGRSRPDVSARLRAAPVRWVVGNHGLEPGGDMKRFEIEVDAACRILRRALGDEQGVDVEDKRYSLAIHYRRSRNKRRARRAISAAIEALPTPMRSVAGKLVVNVIPSRAPNKGDALLELRRRAKLDTALYVGDDVTDEDVFCLDDPGRLTSVRVGSATNSAARYYLRNQSEMDRLLTTLIALRVPGRAR